MLYKAGDTVHYLDFAGTRRTVLVESVSDDIKNGRPGFEGVLLHTTSLADVRDGPEYVWGYESQITMVVPG